MSTELAGPRLSWGERPRAAVLLVGLGLTSCAVRTAPHTQVRAVHFQRFELEWNVEGNCVDRAAARAAITRSLGMRRAAANAVVRVTITHLPEGIWNADMWMYGAQGSGDRSLQGGSCQQVAEAAALIAAVAIADDSRTEPRARAKADLRATRSPSEREHAIDSAVQIEAGVRASGDAGSLPAPTIGLGLLLAVAQGRLRAEAHGIAFWPRNAYGGPIEGGGGELGLYVGGARGCVDALGAAGDPVRLAPCVGAEAGSTIGRGFGISEGETSSNFWSAGFLGLSLRHIGSASLGLELLVEAGVPFRRPVWEIDGVGVFQPSQVLGRASLQAVFRFQ